LAAIQRNIRYLTTDILPQIQASVGAVANHALLDGSVNVAQGAVRATMQAGTGIQTLVDTAAQVLQDIQAVERLLPAQQLVTDAGQPRGQPAQAAAAAGAARPATPPLPGQPAQPRPQPQGVVGHPGQPASAADTAGAAGPGHPGQPPVAFSPSAQAQAIHQRAIQQAVL